MRKTALRGRENIEKGGRGWRTNWKGQPQAMKIERLQTKTKTEDTGSATIGWDR